MNLARRHFFGLAAAAVGGASLVACGDSGANPRTAAEGEPLELVALQQPRAASTASQVAAGAALVRTMTATLWPAVEPGNAAISPFSVAIALGMTVQGAATSTRQEMLAVLDADSSPAVAAACNAISQKVESYAGDLNRYDGDKASIALDSANQLFGQRGMQWRKAFLATLSRDFGTGVRVVDYARTEKARKVINTWTSDQTHHKIAQIIPPGVLKPETRLTLVNALYFKAPWATEFEKSATSSQKFTLADGSTTSVPTMHGTVSRVGQGDGWVSAQLPYAGGKLAMTVIRPDDGRDSDVEAMLSGGKLRRLLRTEAGAAQLAMPRWKFRTALALTAPLAQAGMPTAFSDAADFSAMTTAERLKLAAILHQAFIAVDEAGTEAAAATAVVVAPTSVQEPPSRSIKLDKPFLFVIHTVKAGQTPLFVGRCADPR